MRYFFPPLRCWMLQLPGSVCPCVPAYLMFFCPKFEHRLYQRSVSVQNVCWCVIYL